MAYTISNARNKLKADKANPADYGLRSWDQANYQTLADAIGDIVVKHSKLLLLILKIMLLLKSKIKLSLIMIQFITNQI